MLSTQPDSVTPPPPTPPLHTLLAIYGPMIYSAPYVMFLKRADPLRGEGEGGWALGNDTFLGPEMEASKASAIWAQKLKTKIKMK
jgi:hypothetical protein